MISKFAPILYSWAGRLSARSDCFFPSVDNIAQYFSVHRTTVLRALVELVVNDWFEVIQREPGKPVVYRVVTHNELVEQDRLVCLQKDAFPWTGEGDRMAQDLYAASGGRAVFFPGQMQGLRKSGLDDIQIVQEFRIFLDRNPQKGREWKRVYYPFHTHLHRLAASLRAVDAKRSCSSGSHASDDYQSHSSDTPNRTRATPAGRTGATQVFESSCEEDGEEITIPATLTRERPLIAQSPQRMEGGNPLPNHPPKEKHRNGRANTVQSPRFSAGKAN